jgi:hypothetical protein
MSAYEDKQPVPEKPEQPPKPEHVFDPMTAPKVLHKWVDRGLKLSCEGAGHPMHQAWKQNRKLM